jgi:AcrR family transcriptional regulator
MWVTRVCEIVRQNERSFSLRAEPERSLPKVTPAHEQQRREQILAAAMACFARQGYHATSMDDVVRESGLSVGAIYTYYPSKEDLFLAISDARAQQTLNYLDELFHQPGPLGEKFSLAVDYFFTMLSDKELRPMARVGIEFLSETVKSNRLKACQEQRLEMIRRFNVWLLEEAKRSGEVRAEVDVEAAAELLMALNEGIVLLSLAGLRRVPLEQLKAAYISFITSGLSSPTSSMFAPAGAHAIGDAAAAAPRNGTRH